MQGISGTRGSKNEHMVQQSHVSMGYDGERDDINITLRKMVSLDRISTVKADSKETYHAVFAARKLRSETDELLEPLRKLNSERNTCKIENIDFCPDRFPHLGSLPQDIVLLIVKYVSEFSAQDMASFVYAVPGFSQAIYRDRLRDLVISHASCIDSVESADQALSRLDDPHLPFGFRSAFVAKMFEYREQHHVFTVMQQVASKFLEVAKGWSPAERKDVIKSCLSPGWIRLEGGQSIYKQAKADSETLSPKDKKNVDAFLKMVEIVHPDFTNTLLKIDEDKRADYLIESLSCLHEISEKTEDRFYVTNAVCENMIHLPLSEMGKDIEKVARFIVDIQSFIPEKNRNVNLRQIADSLIEIKKKHEEDITQNLQSTVDFLIKEREKMIQKRKNLNESWETTISEIDQKINLLPSVLLKNKFYSSEEYTKYQRKLVSLTRDMNREYTIIDQLAYRLDLPHAPS